jgi:hypothetical protein
MEVILDIRLISFVNNIDENYKMIAFGDNEEEEKIENYVILQRANTFDEQDKKLGMDSYYIEYNDQSNSGYGVCEQISLDENLINIKFSTKNEKDIKNIFLRLDKAKYKKEELIEYLKFILEKALIII